MSPTAFWFGPPERRAFACYGAPSGPSRSMSVILCPPLGHEMLCTHRAYRHLAERLALLGFPVLRFDYHGTGDSAGRDLEDARVSAWIATIDDAVLLMRDSGVPQVALFGMRMGATLATFAAARRGDIDALALVAPCASGSTYLRELRAMHQIRNRGEKRPPFHGQREGDEEAIGFVFRRETIEALATIDLRKLEQQPAPRAMIIPRDDLPGNEAKIAQRLRTLGTTVDVVEAPGYGAVATDDPYTAKVPTMIWDGVATWLDRVSAAGSPPSPRRPTGLTHVSVGDDVVESAVRYGDDERLFAILSEPLSKRTDVGVIIANTGVSPRAGPNRFSVTIARLLAARGHAVMRIDLGGIGDSPPAVGVAENELFASRSIDDVRAAIDVLATKGYRRFVTTGLCAGAYMAFHAGLADDRIAGMVLMNPPAFEWRPGRKVERPGTRGSGFRSNRYYRNRAFRVDTWKRLVRGEVDARGIARALGTRLRDRVATGVKRSALLVGRGDWVMSDLAQKFVMLAKRNARVLLLFNSEEPMIDEVDRHLGSIMDWLESRGLKLEILDDTDHIFAPVWSQERAADLLTEFVDQVARY